MARKPELMESARTRVHFALTQGAQSLDLSGFELTDLPEEIFEIVSLKRLILKDNRLSRLPSRLAELPNLERLDISNNGIARLPTSMERMAALSDLDLSGNAIDTSGFRPIEGLLNLKKLNITDCDLHVLPDSVVRNFGLQELSVSDNKLSMLPASLSGLTRLQKLRLAKNELRGLPFPDSLPELSSLEYLDISRNSLTSLQARICELPNLQTLNISENHLQFIPPEFGKFAKLESLNASKNVIEELPREMGRARTLKNLNFRNNNLEALGSWIEQLQELTTLNLAENNISYFPIEISHLYKLTTLDLSKNFISSLPDDIGRLKHLRTLNISRNELRRLPPSLGFVKTLEVGARSSGNNGGLSASGNFFEEPLTTIVGMKQPAATIEALRFLRNEEPNSESGTEPENGQSLSSASDVDAVNPQTPDVPDQASGVKFDVNEKGLVDFAAASFEALDQNAVDILHPELVDAARQLLDTLQGTNAYRELEACTRTYFDLVNRPLNELDGGRVWAAGLRIESWAEAISRDSRDSLRPELEHDQRAALNSLLGLHAPFIMSTREGAVLSERSAQYQRGEVDEASYRRAADVLVEALRQAKNLVEPGVLQEISAINSPTVGEPTSSKAAITARAANRNILTVIAKMAAAAFKGPFGKAMGTVVTSTVLYKSAIHIGASGLDEAINFLLANNEIIKLFAAAAGTEMAWLGSFIAWLQSKVS